MAGRQIFLGGPWPGPIAALLVALAMPLDAHANGAFPDEFSVSFPPLAPHRIYVGANFGLVISEDDGATWRYACEPWITTGSNAALSGTNVSFYQVTADDAVLALAVELTRSVDDACTWPFSSGDAISGQVVTDIFPDPSDPTLVVGIVALTNGSSLVVSHDGGQTFDGPPLYMTGELLTTVEISRSTPTVIYATAVPLSGAGASLLRSTDSGAHWTTIDISSIVQSGWEPLILAVDPANANIVYLRVVGATQDSIWITTNGGQTFQPATVPPIPGQFSSFLRAGDGTLYAGTLSGLLYVLPPGATAFTSHSGPHFRCLGQRPGTSRIYACGDLGLDGFSLGYSDDDGGTFTRMMNFTDIQGPLTCGPVASNCVAHWTRIQQVLGIYDAGSGTPDAGPPPLDAGPPSDAGPGTEPDAGPGPGMKSSSCAAAAADGTQWLSILLLALAAAWTFRRRRNVSGRVA